MEKEKVVTVFNPGEQVIKHFKGHDQIFFNFLDNLDNDIGFDNYRKKEGIDQLFIYNILMYEELKESSNIDEFIDDLYSFISLMLEEYQPINLLLNLHHLFLIDCFIYDSFKDWADDEHIKKAGVFLDFFIKRGYLMPKPFKNNIETLENFIDTEETDLFPVSLHLAIEPINPNLKKLLPKKTFFDIVSLYNAKNPAKNLKFQSPLEKKFFENWPFAYVLTRQHPIGKYRADFAILENKIVIEIDGHAYHSTKEQKEKDAARDRFMLKEGWTVIRFPGTEVYHNLEKCYKETLNIIEAK